MRKTLVPMLASLALCGAATAAVVISTAHAQPATHKPMMVAQADNAPHPPGRSLDRPAPADIAQRLNWMCQDMVARQTGDLAYLETSLHLTASEQPLFQRWKDARLAIAHRHADACSQRVDERLAARRNSQTQNNQAQDSQAQDNQAQSNPPGPNRRGANRPSPAERMAQEEDQLKQRLADIDAERPPLEAFFNVLSPDQKMTFERAAMRGRDGMMQGRRFAFAGPRGPMGGPMGRLPLPPQGPGAPPPQDR